MKNTLVKIIALTLALLFVLPLVACTGTPGGTETTAGQETSTKKPSKDTVTETETDDDGYEIETNANNRGENSVCYVGSDGYAPDAVFYDSLDEAVADNPGGATIKLYADPKINGVYTFPDDSEFILEFNGIDTKISFETGFVFEYKQDNVEYLCYYPSIELMVERHSSMLNSGRSPVLWVFGETDAFDQVGRYKIVDINEEDPSLEPEYQYNYFEGLENWGKHYVASSFNGLETVYYYDLQEAISAQNDSAVIVINVMRNNGSFDDETYPLMEMQYKTYRLPYHHFVNFVKFDMGFTYDDGVGGFCYYSDIVHLSAQPGLIDDTCIWVWTDSEGFVPGKYVIRAAKPEDVAELEDCYIKDEESPYNGCYYAFTQGAYTYIREDGVEIDDFFEHMQTEYEKMPKV